MTPHLRWFVLSLGLAIEALAALPAGLLDAALPDALAPARHPRLFVSPVDLATGRRNARETAWGRDYLTRQKNLTARFVALDDAALRALVPKPGSVFVYGLGMNLDPVRQLRMTWAGWSDPFAVQDTTGKRYPNAEWPDTGDGVVDPKTKQRYYFVAQAHGRIVQNLEQFILPALADVYALEGSVKHAHTAAILLDAIAAVYPTNCRGPLDYPTSPGDFARGGRLDRPYYQTARGLVNYGFVIDLVAASGELEAPSAYGTFPRRQHLARNLLWDGGTYCHDFALRGYQLHNGHADYLRGAALVGVLLGVRELAEPMIRGPLALTAMLDVNIDRNGFYYETSPGYASHNRELYVDMAETLLAMRRLGWPDIPDAYAHPNLRLYLTAPFNRQEVGGHLPTLGDAGPDRNVHDPRRRIAGKPAVYSDTFIEAQQEAAWIQLVRGSPAEREAAAQLIADSHGSSPPEPTARRWTIYHVGAEPQAQVKAVAADPARLATGSVFYGAKGLALLRGGTGPQRYGAQLFFGPGHNHSQRESLTWTFFARGAEWSSAPGYFNKHYRTSWVTQSASHQAMTVNQHSAPWENGAARLLAWHPDGDVQWAMAAHPDLYDDLGGSRFERLIAQVHNPGTGEPAYWLDVGRIEGGEIRDDSFHTQMKSVSSSVPLPAADPRRPVVVGPRDLGAAVLASDYIAGFDASKFYLTTPGEGYDFLGSPREIALEAPVRLTFRDPLFATSLPGTTLVADFMGAPGRRLLVTQGGAPHGVARVPYILQRDRGHGLTAFAKVLRVIGADEADPLVRIESIALAPGAPAAARAVLVVWANGRRDLWVVGEARAAVTATAASGLPSVTTDASVACVQFDRAGAATQVAASGAQLVRIAGGPELRSRGVLRGRVATISATAADLRVRWDDADAGGELQRVAPGTAVVTIPPFGPAAAWSFAGASAPGDTLHFSDATLALAQTEMRPVPGKAGHFTFAAGISRFYSGGARPNTRYAAGKAVYAGAQIVGRVRSVAADQSVVLEGPGVAAFTRPATVRVLEVGEGDRIEVALELRWTRAARP